jgi:thiamine pyrophosphokinase
VIEREAAAPVASTRAKPPAPESRLLRRTRRQLVVWSAGSTLLARTKYRYVSLLPIDPVCKGVEIDGCKYPLKHARLSRLSSGRSVSNEITGNCCLISVRKGAAYIVESLDR